MSIADIEAAVATALTAKGAGALSFAQMVELVEVGRARGLAVSTIDATSNKGWTPRPDLGFHIESDDLERMASDPPYRADTAAREALEHYTELVIDDDVEFEVWFWRD